MRAIFLLCLTSVLSVVHGYQVFTITDSIVDHILQVDDAFVDSLPGQKGGSTLVDNDTFETIIQTSGVNPTIRPGSSAVNMVKGLQRLGHTCGILTTIGEDKEGEFFLKSLNDLGITLHLQTSSIPTGKSACLVTPNGERTMRTFFGASRENDRLILDDKMLQDISHFHLEGYQLKHNQLINQAIAIARQNGAKISLDLSSFEVVKANKDFIWTLLKDHHIDVIFANKDEARALTDLPPKQAADLLAAYCPIAVVTMGEQGCVVSYCTRQIQYPACCVTVVDSTGAGDFFVSGFLHGYLTKQPICTCVRWGTQLATEVIQTLGTEISTDQWESILAALKI